MNIFEKLQNCRVELQKMNLKKSGQNKFAGFTYYELGDFLPAINQLFNDKKLTSIVNFTNELASLEIVNVENPEEVIEFTSPMRDLELKGCNQIQALGGIETYQRRYLYMLALEIVENDMFDATSSKDKEETKTKTETKQKIELISEVQEKALVELIKNNDLDIEAVKAVLVQFKAAKIKDIKMSDFAKVKTELEKLKGDK